MYFKKLLQRLTFLLIKKGRIYLNYSSKVCIPNDAIIAIVSPYAEIKGNKEKAFAYLSLTEISSNSPFFDLLPNNMLLRYQKKWDSWLVDIDKPIWMEILNKETELIVKKGFKHIFIDTADGVETLCSLFKEKCFLYRVTVRNIMEHIRELISGKILLNRGFFIYSEIKDLIDGILIESLFFEEKNSYWRQRSNPELSYLYEKAEIVQNDAKEVYAIDYPEKAKQKWLFFRYRAQIRGIIWDAIC